MISLSTRFFGHPRLTKCTFMVTHNYMHYHRATENAEMYFFSFAGRRRQTKTLSPASSGNKDYHFPRRGRLFLSIVISRWTKKKKPLCPLCLSGEQMPVKTHPPNGYGVLASVKQEVLHFNNVQTGESGDVLPQTNRKIFLRTTKRTLTGKTHSHGTKGQ